MFQVWSFGNPVELKFKRNLRELGWTYTQFSEFNSSTTLLLVSGVLNQDYSEGEVAIFNLESEELLLSN